MTRTRGFLGLGSNVGDRRAHLEAAVALLPDRGVEVVRSSSVYETEPVGPVLDQAAFLNAVVEVETAHDLDALIAAGKAVERARGRRPGGVSKGPRELDVDVLMLGEELTHAEVLRRRFVLVPFLELVPDAVALREALARIEGQAVERHSGPLG